MQKWDYKVISLGSGIRHYEWTDTRKKDNEQTVVSRLAEMGQQGWELVSVSPFLFNGHTSKLDFIFKRPIE